MHKLQRQPMKVDGREVVFHGSMKGGLTKIQPNKCKHDRGYVYASENIPLCVIFAVKRSGENVAFGVDVYAISCITKEGLDNIKKYFSKGNTIVFLGSSGVGDPWMDYAWCIWSLEYNLNSKDYTPKLLKELGIEFKQELFDKYTKMED